MRNPNKGARKGPFVLLRSPGSYLRPQSERTAPMKPFKIDVSQSLLDGILTRVRAYEWHEMPRGEGLEGTWAYGANLEFMKDLCSYWSAHYDWRKWERALNRFPQFTADVDGLSLHFYFEEGSGPKP